MTEERWYQGITRYQWRVLVCAWLGWCLDIMDGYLYAIILFPSTSELLGTTSSAIIGWYGGIILSIFMTGWALGGLLFGIVADRYGRAKTMALTILIYATFTGLCGLAQNWVQLAAFRFLTGLGIGGEWAAGAALIAETWPERSRAKAAGIMQSAGAFGFFFASLLYLWVGPFGWRWVFTAGILPAILAFYVRRALREPERWEKARKKLVPLTGLFTAPVRRDLMVGTALAVVATFGFQGAVQWLPAWTTEILHLRGQTNVTAHVALITNLFSGAGILGCLSFPILAERKGRRAALLAYYLGSSLFVPATFLLVKDYSAALLTVPMIGFLAGGVFTGFAVYLPELFPTALRATAQGFCFNFGRLFSAVAPFTAGILVSAHGRFAPAIATVGLVYFVGVVVLFFARETKGQLLPD